MRVNFFIFLLLFVFVCWPIFSATSYNSGSGSMGKPSVKFKKWQVGRSPKGTDTNSKEQKSFITSTEEVCYFTASVVYDGNQGDNVSPIDPSKVTWSVENESHGMDFVETSVEQNWSGPKHPSKLASSTSFNVVGKLTVPQHTGTSKSHCPNYGGNSKPLNGRADTAMTFTIKFSAKTEDNQSVQETLTLVQDERDEMRQEYMDMARLTTLHKGKVDGNVLRVPLRSEFDSQNTYDDGHYSLMMGRNVLPGKHTAWTAAFKKHAKILFGNTEAPDLVETGGYRNPHHHYYHVPNGSASPRGWHQFGLALDVRGKDIDINKDNQRGTITDRLEMANAAKKYAGASWTKHTYSDGHVHAQWEFEGSNKERASTSSGKFSLPPQGTDQPVTVVPAPPASVTGACGSHTIPASQAANHAAVNFACGSHTYYACQTPSTSEQNRHRYRTLPCGSHSGYRCTATSSHTQTTTCPTDTNGQSCSYGSYYACSPHTHAYLDPPVNPSPPANPSPPPTVLCGNRWSGPGACTYGRVVSSSSTEHQATCSTHGTYWSCNPTAYARHGQTHTCRRSGCGATYTKCVKGNGTCTGGKYKWHK